MLGVIVNYILARLIENCRGFNIVDPRKDL